MSINHYNINTKQLTIRFSAEKLYNKLKIERGIMMTSLLDEFFKKSKNNQTDAEIITKGDRSQFDGEIKFKATIHGRVQGVGFRFSTNQLAKELDIRGIVRNESDGTVYVEAVGAEEQIDTFIKRLAQGPSPAADVDKVDIHFDNSIKDYQRFSQAN